MDSFNGLGISPDSGGHCRATVVTGLAWRMSNKYHAKRALWNGRWYDSTAERDYALELDALARAGEISELQMQPRVELDRGIFYKPDFCFQEHGRYVWVDVKGVETERFRLLCKLWRNRGPGPLRIIKRAGRRSSFVVVREIMPLAQCQ